MGGWRVWSELRRRTHIDLVFTWLAGHDGRIEDLGDGRRLISIDARLGRLERRAALSHELVHDERGIFYDDRTPPALVRKEEAIVEAESIRRLVPLDELDQLVTAREIDDGCVTWRDVADWFEVPRDVAEHALSALHRRRLLSRHPAAGGAVASGRRSDVDERGSAA